MSAAVFQVILTGISALIALSAVVVTLFRDSIRQRRRGPILTLQGGGGSVGPHEPASARDRAANAGEPSWTVTNDVACFDDDVPGGSLSYRECYLRLRVHAAPGRDAARGVRAFLLHVERPEKSIRPAVPDYLMKWSGPLDCAEDVDIPSGTFRRLDVLRHRWTCDDDGTPKDLFLTPGLRRAQNTGDNPSPSSRNRLDQAGKYSLIIVLSADNAEPTLWRFSFEHVGGPIKTADDLATCICNPVIVHLTSGWDIRKSPSTGGKVDLAEAHPPLG